MKKLTSLILVAALASSSLAFADTSVDSLREARIQQTQLEITNLEAKLNGLEVIRDQGVVVSNEYGKHIVIITTALAIAMMRLGKAKQLVAEGILRPGVKLEIAGQSLLALSIGEGALVGYDMISLISMINGIKADLNIKREQLDQLNSINK
jgi:hypothetical protein